MSESKFLGGAGADVVVAAVARTPVRPVEAELAKWHPVILGATIGREALARAQLSGNDLDEVVVGCADPVGACGANVARAISLAAGWPLRVGGHVVDRGTSSGLVALQVAEASIRLGQATTVLVIGLGLCSVVPPGAAAVGRGYGSPWVGVAKRFAKRGGLLPLPRLSENAARAVGLGREDLEEAARASCARRSAAGVSTTIAGVAARPGSGSPPSVVRGDLVLEDFVRDLSDAAALPPMFDDDGLLTAATLAPPADAITALVLTSEPMVKPLGTVVGVGRGVGDPFDPNSGLAGAVGMSLGRAGLSLSEIDRVDVVENDAAAGLLAAQALGIDADDLNPAGGAVATGNAGPAEELRLLTDSLRGFGLDADGDGDIRPDGDDVGNTCMGQDTGESSPVSRHDSAGVKTGLVLAVSTGSTGSAAVICCKSS